MLGGYLPFGQPNDNFIWLDGTTPGPTTQPWQGWGVFYPRSRSLAPDFYTNPPFDELITITGRNNGPWEDISAVPGFIAEALDAAHEYPQDEYGPYYALCEIDEVIAPANCPADGTSIFVPSLGKFVVKAADCDVDLGHKCGSPVFTLNGVQWFDVGADAEANLGCI